MTLTFDTQVTTAARWITGNTNFNPHASGSLHISCLHTILLVYMVYCIPLANWRIITIYLCKDISSIVCQFRVENLVRQWYVITFIIGIIYAIVYPHRTYKTDKLCIPHSLDCGHWRDLQMSATQLNTYRTCR